MTDQTAFTLINPQSKALAFRVYAFENDSSFSSLNKYNYFTLILIAQGKGSLMADVSEYKFSDHSLLCFSLYQPFKIQSQGVFKGILINFHPDFFCLHKHRNEVSCNGVLFNNIYDSPVTNLDADEMQSLSAIAHELAKEMQHTSLAQHELLIAYLKIFLIQASRIKLKQQQIETAAAGKEPLMLNALKDAIERHYKTLHSPGEYADLLHISTRALNKISKTHFNKTLSDLITDRIIVEARRELYLTAKPVKLIAYELGFNDEFYFSRFFKGKVAVSPQMYRDTVGFDKANA